MSQTFGTLKQVKDSSTYINDKKAISIFCIGSNCLPIQTSTSNQSSYNLLNTAKLLNIPVKPNYNNLGINLVTSLDLSPRDSVDIIVIQQNSTGTYPAPIDLPSGVDHVEFIADPADPTHFIEQHLTAVYTDDYRYTTYTIDPSGQLFGDTECGLDNWKRYLTLEPT